MKNEKNKHHRRRRRKSTMASDYLQAPAKPISQADSCQIISGAIFLNCTIRSRLSA